jgi:L-2-hydroxyglutarate oxidase
MIGPERLRELEPHAAGIQAVEVPEAGIVDYAAVCRKLAELVRQSGGQVVTGQRIDRVRQTSAEVVLQTSHHEWIAKCVVNCGGLHSDRLAKLSGARLQAKIVPFRGEYYDLKPEFQHFCRNLIYPVPNPTLPFLGVHFTRMIQGGVECGPNAVLAFAREGYRKRDVNLRDLGEALMYPGFLRLSMKYWRVGIDEMWRSFSKRAFVKALRKLIPEIRAKHLKPARAGVRAQAVAADGSMVDDFLIVPYQRVINVCNAPSPAATSALNVGRLIVDRVTQYDV